ncbi:YjbH domain-containing protein [Paracoccaceae bacterium]|nr:YjbH domain-containing protein [Paracoccaceae bacterium]
MVNASETEVFETPRMLNTYGMPGSIDTPTAEAFPEGQFSVSTSIFGGTIRTNLSFQITNSSTVSFRYSRIPSATGDHGGYYWDRSFDFHYLFNEQTKYLPSIAIGLRDFIGTGKYSGEYLVATKGITKNIKLTGGLGWGRLSGTNKHSNIFGRGNERISYSQGFGGTLHANHFFSGTNSPFFNLSYNATPKFQIIAELSSDDYDMEASSSNGFKRGSDLNFAFKYKVAPDFSVIGQLMHGNAFGLSGILTLNPKNSPYKSGIETAPMPLQDNGILLGTQKLMDPNIFNRSAELLELDGIELLSLNITKKTILEVEIVDRNYIDVAQMLGRASRILAKTVPLQVEMFKLKIIDYQSGLDITEVEIMRSAIRENELVFDGPQKLWETVNFDNAPTTINRKQIFFRKNLMWSFYPDIEIMLFDPHSPINGSIGWEAKLNYRLKKSIKINGSIKQPILTALDDIKRGPKEGLPNVRSDYMYYYRDIGIKPYISSLTLDQYFKPLKSIYSQLNIGYLEMMYAGIRSETIWKESKKQYALGLDLTMVKKRNTYGDLSLLDASYSTIIGSIYYDLNSDWNFKLDAGKYLAGDYGATLSLSRTFNNGWEIGAYATLTDVKFSTFGEGSFDKAITLKAPLSWFTGKKSRAYRQTIIKPISGDGGARLYLEDEKLLYESIKIYGQKSFKDNWQRFYR